MVRFEFYPAEAFRFNVEIYQDHGRIWLESRTSKQQWECKVRDAANHVTDGVVLPLDALLRFVVETRTHVIDFLCPNCGGDLHLLARLAVGVLTTCKATTCWKFSFPMTPIALDRLGQLESRVCDLEETVGDLQQLLRQNNHNY